jgi:hypothetical protein
MAYCALMFEASNTPIKFCYASFCLLKAGAFESEPSHERSDLILLIKMEVRIVLWFAGIECKQLKSDPLKGQLSARFRQVSC